MNQRLSKSVVLPHKVKISLFSFSCEFFKGREVVHVRMAFDLLIFFFFLIAKLEFKDLGPQIGYRTVFLVEYFGPILFVLFFYSRPSFIYGADATKQEYSEIAKYLQALISFCQLTPTFINIILNTPFPPYTQHCSISVLCWCLHFVKRELETIFVHR